MSKDETEPAAVTDSEGSFGDFTNTKDFDPAVNPHADELPKTEAEAGVKPAVEPFIVPLDVRRAQRRDTIFFAGSAVITTLAFVAAYSFGALFTQSANEIASGFVIVTLVALLITLIAAALLVSDTVKGQRHYNTSTREWLMTHYGLAMDDRKIKAMGRGRMRAAGSTVWRTVPLDGHAGGVQIVHNTIHGYRLVAEKNGDEVELTRRSTS